MTDDYGADIDRLTNKSSKLACQNGIQASRCEFRALGERCQLPGTISSDTRGPGQWFCLIHWRQLQGRLTAEQAAEKVRERLRAGRQSDWREEALQGEMAARPAARAPGTGRAAETTEAEALGSGERNPFCEESEVK
ncbi:MAG: hypothetical protein ACREV4_15580 [Gammaproteobacteria bacterium]